MAHTPTAKLELLKTTHNKWSNMTVETYLQHDLILELFLSGTHSETVKWMPIFLISMLIQRQ